jgi:hypothetical protein
MSAKDRTAKGPVASETDPASSMNATAGQDRGPAEGEVIASAKHMPRPKTTLPGRPTADVGKLKVTALTEPAFIPTLEEIAAINQGAQRQGRTPLMTVIQAVLVKHGGTMTITDLTAQIRTHWNRLYPGSPYNSEQFIYVMVRSADDLRVSES